MATMKQVAERAGVSISTVSHVINNTRAVSDDVRQRVLGIIEEMRYVPSAVARSLKNDKTNIIGVLVPNSSNPYFAELIRWIEDAAFESGYHIILCNAHGDAHKQTVYLRLLMEKRIDGLVLIASGADEEHDLLLRHESVPIIQLERALPGLDGDLVLAGQEEAPTSPRATCSNSVTVRSPACPDRPSCRAAANAWAASCAPCAKPGLPSMATTWSTSNSPAPAGMPPSPACWHGRAVRAPCSLPAT